MQGPLSAQQSGSNSRAARPIPASADDSGGEVLIELDRDAGRPLRAQLEDALRAAIRSGRIAPSTRLPSSRALASDLGVSRRLVVDAYTQLSAEGYLVTRQGSGTRACGVPHPPRTPSVARVRQPRVRYEFAPSAPDLSCFPRAVWIRALREVLRTLPDHRLGYPNPQGVFELRRELAAYLGRVRGVAAHPEQIVVVTGVTQALALLANVLARDGRPRIGVEDPGFPYHREVLAYHGAVPVPIPVDEDGIRVDLLSDANPGAAVVTPAHQMPLGVVMAPSRRASLLEWDGLVIEDDYHAEFRYDSSPIGSLQGLAPERVVYVGSSAKSLAPAPRIGWLVAPEGLVDAILEAKLYADRGGDGLTQHVLARLIETGAYDRHLRQVRRRHRSRRDAFLGALAANLPEASPTGIGAGLHVVVNLPWAVDLPAFYSACTERHLRVYAPQFSPSALVVGYSNIAEESVDHAVRLLAEAVLEARLEHAHNAGTDGDRQTALAG